MIREEYRETGELEAAIENSIRKCRDEGVLAEFLKEHGGEVISFLFEKLTREECEAIREADGFDNGYEKGYEIGEAAGFEKGKAEGSGEGALSERLRIAMNLKNKGMTISEIQEITGLEAEQIENL